MVLGLLISAHTLPPPLVSVTSYPPLAADPGLALNFMSFNGADPRRSSIPNSLRAAGQPLRSLSRLTRGLHFDDHYTAFPRRHLASTPDLRQLEFEPAHDPRRGTSLPDPDITPVAPFRDHTRSCSINRSDCQDADRDEERIHVGPDSYGQHPGNVLPPAPAYAAPVRRGVYQPTRNAFHGAPAVDGFSAPPKTYFSLGRGLGLPGTTSHRRSSDSRDSETGDPNHELAQSWRRVFGSQDTELTLTADDDVFRTRADRRGDTAASFEHGLDEDDPRVTGVVKSLPENDEQLHFSKLKAMTYKERNKEHRRLKITQHVVAEENRYDFIMSLAGALMAYGAPSHRLQSQLIAVARVLNIDAEFICLPAFVMGSFGDATTRTSETRTVRVRGALALGKLHEVHQIYRDVVHDKISAHEGRARLEYLKNAPPEYSARVSLVFTFLIAALVCPLSFGGSLVDMWIAGIGAVAISCMKVISRKHSLYSNCFEICCAVVMSFVARGLSSIRSQIFCYNAISSAGIVAVLPGYLVLTASLELGSKNMISGSVKMVWALVYTLFLGFGLQIGSDLFLAFDQSHRHYLRGLSGDQGKPFELVGSFQADHGSKHPGLPTRGLFQFTTATELKELTDWNKGCYRPAAFPWYLQRFPWWSAFALVPLFALIKSLANQQPWRTRDLPVMVTIACIAYAANVAANRLIFEHSDIVSAIGAFVCGLLGNAYSRKYKGTAFTVMVTGVLFLVPSSLSRAGGITAEPDVIDIAGAMISVSIGVTVGLFMSQAVVYTFGERKRAGIFSF